MAPPPCQKRQMADAWESAMYLSARTICWSQFRKLKPGTATFNCDPTVNQKPCNLAA